MKFATTKEKIDNQFKSHNAPKVRIMTRHVREKDSNQQKQ